MSLRYDGYVKIEVSDCRPTTQDFKSLNIPKGDEMFNVIETKKYTKDLKKSHLKLMQNVRLHIYLQSLKNGFKLDPQARCKKLAGEWLGYNEISISWDLRLIYKLHHQRIELVRIGTHTQLFKK